MVSSVPDEGSRSADASVGGARWSTSADIEAAVRRRWDDGTLLRAHAAGGSLDPITVLLRGPKPSQIGDDLAAARDWVAGLEAGGLGGRAYEVEWAAIGGRAIGRNRIPARAVITTLDQAWTLLRVSGPVRRFDRILTAVADSPAVRAWVVAHPWRALELASDIPPLLAAFHWLDAHRGSGRYLREISAPGVDTKFAEAHRGVLATLLGVSATAAGFVTDLGLRHKPEFVRMRVSPSLNLALGTSSGTSPGESAGSALETAAPLSEIAVRATELGSLRLAARSALVIENEITYLSAPVPVDGVVLWGKGFAVDLVGRLPWLADANVHYWGDLDTHGFAILDRLRARLPRTRSVLMDHETLLAHRDRWGSDSHSTAASLTRLTTAERDVYSGLVSDVWGERVQLEQERIDWTWATDRLNAVTRSA